MENTVTMSLSFMVLSVCAEKFLFVCFIQADNCLNFLSESTNFAKSHDKKSVQLTEVIFTLVLTCDNKKIQQGHLLGRVDIGQIWGKKTTKQTRNRQAKMDDMMYRRTGHTKTLQVRQVRQTRLLLSRLFYCSAQ